MRQITKVKELVDAQLEQIALEHEIEKRLMAIIKQQVTQDNK